MDLHHSRQSLSVLRFKVLIYSLASSDFFQRTIQRKSSQEAQPLSIRTLSGLDGMSSVRFPALT